MRATTDRMHHPIFIANQNVQKKSEQTTKPVILTGPISWPAVWAGRVISGLAAAFLLLDGVMKLFKPRPVVEATVQLGYPESTIVGIGVILLIATVVYLIPRTAILGAILLTGYLGGAVATHVRAGGGLFPILFPVVFGALVWGGLYLRDQQLRGLVPLRGGDN